MVSYGHTDPAEAQKYQDRLMKGDWWKPRDGRNHLRIMPPWAADVKKFWYEWFLHWQVGARNAVTPCLLKHGGDRCAVCEENARAPDSELAKTMKRENRAWINIVDLENTHNGVQYCGVGVTFMRGILSWENNPDYGDITHPEQGFDLWVEKFTSSPWYTVQAAREPTPLADMTWLEELKDLSQIFSLYTYDQQLALLRGEAVVRPTTQDSQTQQTTTPVQQPAQAPAQTQQPVQKNKPRCFGTFDPEDVAICPRCNWREQCSVHGVEKTAAPVAEVSVAAVTPRCFGLGFEAKAAECKECGHRKGCFIKISEA